MKTTLTTLLLITLISSCNNTPANENLKVSKNNTVYWSKSDENIIEFVYDSCEYIKFNYGRDAWGGHKGNCKFCKQRNK